MSSKINAEKMAAYRATAKRRQQEKALQAKQKQQRAWEVARQAAELLKTEFGADKVVVFGSVLFPERFHHNSDVDLAVWGIAERDYYRAVSRLLDLDPTISVDLVEAEHARPVLLAVIETEGVKL